MEKQHRGMSVFLDVLLVLLGTFIYAAGLYFFIEPANIAPGGVSGIAVLINYLTHAPIGIVSAAINIPLILIGYRFVGREFIWKTLLSIASFTVFYDYVLSFFPVYQGERLLSCIFGGVIWGIGIGLVFLRSGSTGGTDIIIKIINKKFPHMPLGRVTLATDAVIILASVFVYHSIESALYAIITIFVCSQVMDTIIYGGDKGKLVYIISRRPREIADAVMAALDRGTTFLKGEGGYTGEDKRVLMCALRRNEYHTVKTIVQNLDPDAFMIVSDSSEVRGEGFKAMAEKE